MRKPSHKQTSLKTSWSHDDELEFFNALARATKNRAKVTMLRRRANAIKPNHPREAIQLLNKCLTDFPDDLTPHYNEPAMEIGAIAVQIGAPELAADRLQAFSNSRLSAGHTDPDALRDFMMFIAENQTVSHYQAFIDMVSRVNHQTPEPDPPRVNTLATSWLVFGAAAYFADVLGNKSLSEHYLEKVKAYHLSDHAVAPAAWRLWLFKKLQIGARNLAYALARPDYSLVEIRDWAEQNWKVLQPDITYSKIDGDERLILMFEEFALDLRLMKSERRAGNFKSYFKKKNLGKFDTDGAKAVSWREAGDDNGADASSISIELLDYFREEPRLVVNIG